MTDAPYLRLLPIAPVGAARFRHLENYEDDFMLLEGEPVADEFPTDAAYRMNADFPDDIALEDAAFNLDNQLVAGERLQAFLRERVPADDVEFLPVSLINHKGRAESGYAIANVVRHVDCVDQEATSFEWNALDDTAMVDVKNLTIDPERVPDDVLLFRLAHVTDVIGVRRDLAETLEAEGFTGLDFTDFADYRG